MIEMKGAVAAVAELLDGIADLGDPTPCGGFTVADLLAYLALPPAVAGAVNYKADAKPASSEKVTFEALLDSSGITPEQKADIYTSSE